MNKKLIIYTSFPYWPRLETELEIADNHISQGYEVLFLSCMGSLEICPDNLSHRRLKCLSCTSRLKNGYRWLCTDRARLKRLYNITMKQQGIITSIIDESFNSWEELRDIQIEYDDVGEAAFSELVSHLRETNPDFNKNKPFSMKLLKNALIVHFSILNFLEEEKPDKFILFNGRISAYRPALRVGVALGIETQVFEVLGTFDSYVLTNNVYPHNPIALGKQLLSVYHTSQKTEEEKYEIATKWYTGRVNGISDEQFLFTKKQKKGFGLRKLIDVTELKVGIFISSEDELFAIAEHKSPFYKDQNSAIARIADDLKSDNILLIVRAHPHLSGLRNSQLKGLSEICGSRNNILFVPPSSKVSTYELIELCDLVLVFGSTAGIEAVYMGKPTILMGMAIYRGFGGTIEPDSHESLIDILRERAKSGKIPPQFIPTKKAMQDAATIYAFGLSEIGIKQKYQQLTTFHKISWIRKNGVISYIRPHLFYQMTDHMYRIVTFPRRQFSKILDILIYRSWQVTFFLKEKIKMGLFK